MPESETMNAPLPETSFPPTVPALLAYAVERFGDDDFLVMPGHRISFREADSASRLLAKRLVAAGLGKGARIGLLIPSGVSFATAWFAAARIGAIPMHFSTTYRAGELRDVLRLGDVQLLITVNDLVGRHTATLIETALPGIEQQSSGQLLLPVAPYLRSVWFMDFCDRGWASSAVDVFEERVASIDDRMMAEIESEVSPSDVLAVVFTSGSAAQPKAVVHSQGNGIRKTGPGVKLWPEIAAPRRYFCGMPFFWIGGTQMLLSALHHGGTIVCQERFDAAEAAQLIRREHCSGMSGWLVDQIPGAAEIENVNFSLARDIKHVSSKGDPRNLGMTETFGPHRDPAFFEYRVLDPVTGEALPDGTEGEFCVRGPGMMLEMYKKERHEVFDFAGFHHTGDRGYVEDGTIFFTGRYSEMIKSAGANVAPQEVERALMSLPDVASAVVFGIPDERRGELIVALVVPSATAPDVDAEAVKAQLRDVISPYKIPQLIHFVEETDIPRLMSGKADKISIRSAFVARSTTQTKSEAT